MDIYLQLHGNDYDDGPILSVTWDSENELMLLQLEDGRQMMLTEYEVNAIKSVMDKGQGKC